MENKITVDCIRYCATKAFAGSKYGGYHANITFIIKYDMKLVNMLNLSEVAEIHFDDIEDNFVVSVNNYYSTKRKTSMINVNKHVLKLLKDLSWYEDEYVYVVSCKAGQRGWPTGNSLKYFENYKLKMTIDIVI